MPQDSSSSADPANPRSDEGVSGIWRKPPEKQKMETAREQRETACETSQNGQRSSQIILRMQKYPQPQTFLMTQIRNVLSKWHPRSTSASEPKWQGLLAEDVLANQFFGQKKFGDLITGDYKVLNEGCKSLLSRGTRSSCSMDSVVPVQNKNFSGDGKEFTKVLRAVWTAESEYTVNSLEFGMSCQDLSWNHRTSTLHRPKTNGIAERAVRRIKEGMSAVQLQSGLDEKWWAESMECFCYLRNVEDLLADGKTPYEWRFGEPYKGPVVPFGAIVEHHPISSRHQSRLHQFGKKVLPGIFLGYALIVGDLEGIYSGRRHWGIGKFGRGRHLSSKNPCKRCILSCRWYSKIVRKRPRIPRTHSNVGTTCKERRSQWRTSRRTRRVSTDRVKRWRWSPERLLVDPRWLHLSSSLWTSSSTPCRNTIPLNCVDVTLERIQKNLTGDICGPGDTKIQATNRLENLWPEVRSEMGKAMRKKEKEEWVNEKTKLDNARCCSKTERPLFHRSGRWWM